MIKANNDSRLKFRVWDGPLRRYEEVSDIHFTSGTVGYITYNEEFEEYDYTDTVITEGIVIEQYTGLKDKNGVEIYEGDIVSHYGDNMVVKFIDGSFVKSHNKKHHYPKHYPLSDGLSVKGNIHENPELIE